MAVSRLALTDFRSHASLLVEPGPGLVVLVGPNGAGKTNVLEALSLLAPGRGLRRAPLGEMARVGGAGGFAVAARLADGVEIGTGTEASAPERRIVRVNGAPAPAASLAERVSLVWLTPAMDRLFADPPSGRRRFLDRLVLALEPGHARHAVRYETALRERTRLLADPGGADAEWLSALEHAMAEHGAAIAAARERLVAALSRQLAGEPEDPFARPTLALAGGTGSDASELAAMLAEGRGRDAQAGRALAGPHRADLLVTHVAKDQPAQRCSTGEQKALLLAIVLAHSDLVATRAGARPLLLLDEVAAHLDPGRRAALLDRLAGRGGQAWLTGTERALFADAPGSPTWLALGSETSGQSS